MPKISDRTLFVVSVCFIVLVLVSVIATGGYQIYKLLKNPLVQVLPAGQKLNNDEIGVYLESQGFKLEPNDSACKEPGSCSVYVNDSLQMAAVTEENGTFFLVTQINFTSREQAQMAIAILKAIYIEEVPQWTFSHVPGAFKGDIQNGTVQGLKIQVVFDDQGFLEINIQPNS